MAETRRAVLLMAYGSPRAPDEILPYYTDIRRGRPPSDEQLADLTRRYDAIGGISPLVKRSESQRDALQAALDSAAPEQFVVSLGMKHATPTIEMAVDEIAGGGFRDLVALVLAPHYSSGSIGQYLDRASAAAVPHGIKMAAIASWATEPAFIEFLAGEIRTRLSSMPANTKVLFTAHSLPERIIAAGDPYPAELRATARAVACVADLGQWSQWGIAWQSAGRTPEPWLAPDILEVISAVGCTGARGVLVAACGFVADHLEVLYDLDIEAKAHAEALGLVFDRAACVNDDARVMQALASRVIEAAGGRS